MGDQRLLSRVLRRGMEIQIKPIITTLPKLVFSGIAAKDDMRLLEMYLRNDFFSWWLRPQSRKSQVPILLIKKKSSRIVILVARTLQWCCDQGL